MCGDRPVERCAASVSTPRGGDRPPVRTVGELRLNPAGRGSTTRTRALGCRLALDPAWGGHRRHLPRLSATSRRGWTSGTGLGAAGAFACSASVRGVPGLCGIAADPRAAGCCACCGPVSGGCREFPHVRVRVSARDGQPFLCVWLMPVWRRPSLFGGRSPCDDRGASPARRGSPLAARSHRAISPILPTGIICGIKSGIRILAPNGQLATTWVPSSKLRGIPREALRRQANESQCNEIPDQSTVRASAKEKLRADAATLRALHQHSQQRKRQSRPEMVPTTDMTIP